MEPKGKLSKEELKIQQALGTKDKYCFVGADWKDIDGLIDGFTEAFENFGLYVYENPCYDGFIVTDHEMSNEELKEESGYNDLLSAGEEADNL
jgi:hypothetical protein